MNRRSTAPGKRPWFIPIQPIHSRKTPQAIGTFTTDNGDHVSTAYDRLGRVHSTTDQRGVTHEFLYNTAGRLKGDVVDLSGELPDQNVDDTITAIGTTYDDLGRVEFVSSLCGEDTNEDGLPDEVVNQVKEEYNGWGQVAREYQAHDGVVDTGVNGTPFVQYDYDDGYENPSETSRPAKYVRLQSVTYPSADRVIEYGYGDAQSTDINKVIDAVMSRLETIGNASEIDAAYTYLGAGTIVKEDYVSAGTRLNYLDTTGQPSRFDRFGRIADQVWEQYDENGDVTDVLDHYHYEYDPAGNRISKENVVSKDQESSVNLDETYNYDDMDRLTSWSLNGNQQKAWNLDSLGNNLTPTNGNVFNAVNEQTSIADSSVTPTYDAAGNMITLSTGMTAKYDAWNRMVEVKEGSVIKQRNEYDGQNRRIQIFTEITGNGALGGSATVEDEYLAGQQVVETDKTTDWTFTSGWHLATGGGTAAGGSQYLWSPRYIDALILRDTLTTDQSDIQLPQRIFYLADANYNVTGLLKKNQTSDQWQVVERYSYTPYGQATVRYGNDGTETEWTQKAGNLSSENNTVLYTGRTLDTLISLYYYRARFYDAVLERFINRDPAGYVGGFNLYLYVNASPQISLDPSGEIPCGGFKFDSDITAVMTKYTVFGQDVFDPACSTFCRVIARVKLQSHIHKSFTTPCPKECPTCKQHGFYGRVWDFTFPLMLPSWLLTRLSPLAPKGCSCYFDVTMKGSEGFFIGKCEK